MKKFTVTVLAPLIALVLGTPAFAGDAGSAKAGRVDINTATEAQLKALPGVGDAEAQKIMAARPYFKKDDLKTRGVLPADQFEKIQRLIDSVC